MITVSHGQIVAVLVVGAVAILFAFILGRFHERDSRSQFRDVFKDRGGE